MSTLPTDEKKKHNLANNAMPITLAKYLLPNFQAAQAIRIIGSKERTIK
jgi:hypothetical protein